MNPIIPAMALKQVAEFGAWVGMNLYLAWHRGASHERAERYRVRLAELELKRKQAKELK
ncbi:MAG: hypothetical protein WCI95_03190 [bacterium]